MKFKLLKIMSQYFEGLLALIYPNFCVICSAELNQNNDHFCFLCEQDLHYTYFEKYQEQTVADQVFWGRLNIENVYALLYYEEGSSTRNILHDIKYNEGQELAVQMGRMMGRKLKNSARFKGIEVLVPIPIHSKKNFSRGYNQSFLIAQGLGEELNIPVIDILYRKTHDESQTKKTKDERYKNVKGKFALKKNALLGLSHVMIVDDVLTTGATLEFATRAIYEVNNNVKVSLGTIALAQ